MLTLEALYLFITNAWPLTDHCLLPSDMLTASRILQTIKYHTTYIAIQQGKSPTCIAAPSGILVLVLPHSTWLHLKDLQGQPLK